MAGVGRARVYGRARTGYLIAVMKHTHLSKQIFVTGGRKSAVRRNNENAKFFFARAARADRRLAEDIHFTISGHRKRCTGRRPLPMRWDTQR